MNDAQPIGIAAQEAPADEYALVEVFGHRSHWGRILEVERFGAKLMRIDVPSEGSFEKGYTSHFYGGSAIFSMTPTDKATVEKRNQPYQPARPMLRYQPDEYEPDEDDQTDDEGEEGDDPDFAEVDDPPPAPAPASDEQIATAIQAGWLPYSTVEEAEAAGYTSGTLANGDTFGDEDDHPEGGETVITEADTITGSDAGAPQPDPLPI